MKEKKRRLSLICAMHYVKLVYRAAIFALAAVMYGISRREKDGELFGGLEKGGRSAEKERELYAVIEIECKDL